MTGVQTCALPISTAAYSFVPFHQDTSFLIIGERTNANGSRAFKRALLAEDWDACTQIARDQVAESAHLLDVSVDRSEERRVGKECRSRWSAYH